jgi:hypothetical protein
MTAYGAIGSKVGIQPHATSGSLGPDGWNTRRQQAGVSGRIFAPTAKYVSGTLKENGTLVASRLVAAIRKHDHVCLGMAVTDGSGAYSILCGASDEVYVVAFDPTTYQAIVYDQVIPV